MAHHWTQEWYWFNDKWSKQSVESLIVHLLKLAEDGVWVWPGNILDATVQLKQHLRMTLDLEFTTDEITAGINRLFERHCVFNWLKNKPDFTWDSSNNKLTANHDAWLKAGQEDDRARWYSSNGDPFWCELGMIFVGMTFEDVPNTTEDLGDSDSGSGEEVKSTFEHDKVGGLDFVIHSPRPGPAYINLGDTPAKGSPWPRKYGSPSNYLSPFQSPGFQYISREEFESSASANKSKSKSKKKLFQNSPTTSAGSVESNSINDGALKNLTKMFETVAGKKNKKSG